MKLKDLPIWPRIEAANPPTTGHRRRKRVVAARGARNILLAVLAQPARLLASQAGPVQHKIDLRRPAHYSYVTTGVWIRRGNAGGHAWAARAARWTQAQRDERRALARPDTDFGRAWRKAQAQAKRTAALAAARQAKIEAICRRVAGTGHYGPNIAHESQRVGARKWRTKTSAAAGVTYDPKIGITFWPTGHGARRVIAPAIPAPIRDACDLSYPAPIARSLPVPVTGQAGVMACMISVVDSWVVGCFAVLGHRVPECVARGQISLADIAAENNSESKRIMIERYGVDRYVRESAMTPVQSDDWGTLYDLGSHRVVRLLNSTTEADGTAREYFRAVPRECATAHAAVAWTFGLTAETYRPAVMS